MTRDARRRAENNVVARSLAKAPAIGRREAREPTTRAEKLVPKILYPLLERGGPGS